jgi:general secretion pathway protein J
MTVQRRPRPWHAAGFTLVEVLVALMVMAVMAGMAWQGVAGIVRARDASQSRLELTLRLNTVLAQWEQDLGAVQETPSTPALLFDGSTVRLTRRTAAGMQVVAWSLRGSGVLTRWAGPVVSSSSPLQESWLRTLQFLGNEPGQLRALVGVAQWQLYFFRGNAWSNAQSSADVAAPAATPGQPALPLPTCGAGALCAAPRQVLPTGVRMVIGFDAGSGLNGILTRDVALGPQLP